MEPTALQGAQELRLTPRVVQQGDLAALFQTGAKVQGEVVGRLPGGDVLLAVAGERITVRSEVPLLPGQSLDFRAVLGANGEKVLQLVPPEIPAQGGVIGALRSVVGSDRPVGELLGRLAARLRGAIAAPDGGRPNQASHVLLGQLNSHIFQPGQSGAELKMLMAASGLGLEAAILAAASGGVPTEEVGRLLRDLKAQILRSLHELPPAARHAAEKTLAGIEAEQLLNTARREAGEPQHWSFPVVDADQWTTAHLLVQQREGGKSEAEDGQESHRLLLSIEYQKTGPIRIDMLARADHIALRLSVSTEELAELIRFGSEALQDRLSMGKRSVQITVATAPESELRFEPEAMDISLLRDNHLMDVSG